MPGGWIALEGRSREVPIWAMPAAAACAMLLSPSLSVPYLCLPLSFTSPAGLVNTLYITQWQYPASNLREMAQVGAGRVWGPRGRGRAGLSLLSSGA